jgi:hypothetical protein
MRSGQNADGNLVAKIRFSSSLLCVCVSYGWMRKDYKAKEHSRLPEEEKDILR